MTADQNIHVLLETMSGKGTEIGVTFEELKAIRDGVKHPEKIGICLDTCHVFAAGYDIVNDLEGVLVLVRIAMHRSEKVRLAWSHC